MTLGRLLGAIIILWSFFYTLSYGVWVWKNKNKLGAIMVLILAIASVLLPVYSVFLRVV